MKRRFKKGDRLDGKDNTVLFCPSASYKYNYGTYQKSKQIFLIASVVGCIGCGAAVAVATEAWIQTLFSTLLGGLLSIIIWLLTSYVMDEMKHEQDEIDRLLYIVNQHLAAVDQKSVWMTYMDGRPGEEKSIDADPRFKFIWLVQLCSRLSRDMDINSSKLVLKWDKKEYTLKEFCVLTNRMIGDEIFSKKPVILDENAQKTIDEDLYELKFHLYRLKDKLERYKTYISKKRPPLAYEDMEDYTTEKK